MKTDEMKMRLERGLQDLTNFLQSGEGKSALYFLNVKYGGSVVVPNNPYETYKRIGEKEMYDYFCELRDSHKL
jgi:hypothetical protein